MKRIGHTILFCLFGVATAFADAAMDKAALDQAFIKANQEYAAGDFKAAIKDYETLVRSGAYSANLFYNLGNACFRTEDFARAILNYERALALDPRHPEAAANLRLTRDRASALNLQPTPLERAFQFGSIGAFAVAAAVAFWIGLFCIARRVFASQRGSLNTAGIVVGLAAGAIAIAAVYIRSHGHQGDGLAVVTSGPVNARVATADTANSVLVLPAGSEIKILSQRGDWIYAALPNDQRGWLPSNKVEPVRL